jgi:hypothetical protein
MKVLDNVNTERALILLIDLLQEALQLAQKLGERRSWIAQM